MSRHLRLDLVQPSGTVELGQIQGGQVLLGREPDDGGIAVPNQAVSRNHALIARIRAHWFLKDLGSTNGTWINGVPAREGVWRLIRQGDVIQLADAVIGLSDVTDGPAQPKITGFPALGGVSLIVFSKGEFLDEYPVPEYGRALVLGGSQGDLQIEGNLNEGSSLVIERRSMNVCASGGESNIKVLYNEKEMHGVVSLNDRDELRLAHYYIIFNNPSANSGRPSKQRLQKALGAAQAGENSPLWKEWSESERAPDYSAVRGDEGREVSGRSVFGTVNEGLEVGMDETIAIGPEEVSGKIAGYDMHPSMRYVMEEPEPSALAALDEKIVFILGIVLLVGLVGLMLFWTLG